MPLTPEEAAVAVELFGGHNAAARALGVASSTFHHWLDPQTDLERNRSYRAANADRERERSRENYRNENGFKRNRRRLNDRRVHALRRMAERNQRPTEEAN